MHKIKMPFGKYKGEYIEDILKKDKSYVKWLYTDCSDDDISYYAGLSLGYINNHKIEDIVIDCITSRGYSPSEASLFIKKLKGLGGA